MVETIYSRAARRIGHGKQIGIAAALTIVAVLVAGMFSAIGMQITGRSDPSPYTSFLATGFGFAAVALAYLTYTNRGLGYIDGTVPTARSISLGVGLGVGIFTAQTAIDLTARIAGVSMGVDQAASQLTGSVPLLVAAIAINLALIGPAEELFFRNVLQKRLAESFRTGTAIGLTSLIFAPLHLGNFHGQSALAIGVSLSGVVIASVLLGIAFVRYNRLEVVGIAHGIQNSLVLVTVYLFL